MKAIQVEKRARSAGRGGRGSRASNGATILAPLADGARADAALPEAASADEASTAAPRETLLAPPASAARDRRRRTRVGAVVLLERRCGPPPLEVPEEWLFRIPQPGPPAGWLALRPRPFESLLALVPEVVVEAPARSVAPEPAPPAAPGETTALPGASAVEALWLRYAEQRDIDTRNLLVEHYRALVGREARRIAARLPRRVDTRDLETAGVVGLIDAIQNYDLGRGVMFESYGRPRVRGAILDELRRLDWMPRVWRTRRTRRAQAEEALREQLGREPGERELAEYLGVTPEEFRDRYGGPARGLEMAGEGSSGWGEDPLAVRDRFDGFADPRSGEEESRMQVRELIESLLEELDPDDRRVLLLRYFRGWTMGRIGQLMHISESRVCRIHASILERLKRRLESRRPELLS